MKQIYEDFCNSLYASKVRANERKLNAKSKVLPVIISEVDAAIRKTKPDKCSGKEKIRDEHLKTGG